MRASQPLCQQSQSAAAVAGEAGPTRRRGATRASIQVGVGVSFLLASLVLLVAAVPAQAERRFCDVRPGATIVSDGSHRVYETVIPVKGDSDADVTTVYGCSNGTRMRSRRLERYHNTIDGAARVASGRLAGRWLVLDISEETGVTAGHALRVFDLRSGKRAKGGLYVDGADDFRDYALTDDGAFAVEDFDGALVGYDNAGSHDLAPAATALGAGGAFVYWRNPDRTAGSFELAGPPAKFFDIE